MKTVFLVIENIDGYDEVHKVFASAAAAELFAEELRVYEDTPVAVVEMNVE